MKSAFSTVACPDWTLGRVAEVACRLRYDGVELRTLGFGSTTVACDPLLTDANKIDKLFDGRGLTPMCIATSLRFDAPVFPPVIGRLLRDFAKPIRQCKAIVQHASKADIPFVRVFGFEISGKSDRRSSVRQIGERLRMAVDGCAKTGVRLLIETGGSFCMAEQVAELVQIADWDGNLAVSYNTTISRAGGCNIDHAIATLGSKLEVVKIKDLRDGDPCAPGEGDCRVRESLEALTRAGYRGWVVYEHDRLWQPDAPEPEKILERFRELVAEASGAGVTPSSVTQSAPRRQPAHA